VGSFGTPEIPFPVTSVAVDTDRGTLLLGGPDGSINEFTRDGFFLEPVVPAGLFDGKRSSSDRGLAYVPNPPRIYSSGGASQTALCRYSRSGELQDVLGLFGHQHFEGLFFEQRGSAGILHILQTSESSIYAFTFSENRDFLGPRFQLDLNLSYEERRELTGITLLLERKVLLVSLEHAELLLAVPRNPSPAHGEIVPCEIAGSIDLRDLGIHSVHDLAHDPQTDAFFLTDPSQGKVFELAFTSSVPFHRGDADGTGSLNVIDAVSIMDFLFLGESRLECLAAGDSNADRRVDVSDAVFLLQVLFNGGPEPPEPGPPGSPCGADGDPAHALLGLGCDVYRGCGDDGSADR